MFVLFHLPTIIHARTINFCSFIFEEGMPLKKFKNKSPGYNPLYSNAWTGTSLSVSHVQELFCVTIKVQYNVIILLPMHFSWFTQIIFYIKFGSNILLH